MALQTLTKNNFDKVITDHSMVLVDFWAHWCGPCRAFSEIYQAVSKEYPKIIFGQVNIEEEPELAKDFDIRSIPFLMVFRGDLAVYAEPGALTAPALKAIIEQASALDLSQIRKKIDLMNQSSETSEK